jgi:hypothetical protein
MPKTGMNQQVVGLGFGGPSESSDCSEKQHSESTLAVASLTIGAPLIKKA